SPGPPTRFRRCTSSTARLERAIGIYREAGCKARLPCDRTSVRERQGRCRCNDNVVNEKTFADPNGSRLRSLFMALLSRTGAGRLRSAVAGEADLSQTYLHCLRLTDAVL